VRSNPEALTAIREKDGHSQLSLSKKSGVAQSRISRLEADSVPIRPSTAKRLADALGVPISAITQPEPAQEMAS
jgi:transcriptional regulator with XRE-family HTH domain